MATQEEDVDVAATSGARGHRRQRRERLANAETTVIKTGLRGFCKEPALQDMIERAVVACSQTSWEASMFASFHVLRCLETGNPVEPLDQSFWDHCIMSIASGSIGRSRVTEAFRESYHAFVELRPGDYTPPAREPFMCRILQGLRETMVTNFKTVFAETFSSRLCRWLRLCVLDSDLSILKEAKRIKSAVTVLRYACTDGTGSISAIIDRFSRLEDVDDESRQWMQHLVDNVRSSIGPLPLQLTDAKAVPSYFPFLRRMLADIETHVATAEKCYRGMRTFSLLPQKTFRAPFIHISNTVLKEMLACLRGRKNTDAQYDDPHAAYIHYLLEVVDDDEELWKECFDIKKVVKGRKRFACSIKTDGVSVSVTVDVPRAHGPIPLSGGKRKKALKAQENVTMQAARDDVLQRCQRGLPGRTVAIDPGFNAPFTGAVYNFDAELTLTQPENVPFELVSWSAGKYHHERGNKYAQHQMRRWTEACPDVTAFNKTVTTAKTASLETYSERVTQVLAALPVLMDFYVRRRRVRRCRWYNHMRKQKSLESMVSAIAGTVNHGEQRDVLVAYGNAAMHAVQGTKPVLQKGLRQKLRSRCMFVDVDEFRTSKLCCACHREMKGKMLKTGKRSYKVRRCENGACHRTFWNRDVNASINILFKLLRGLRGEDEPAAFCRTENL